jgi:predicted Zn-dependent peptidase
VYDVRAGNSTYPGLGYAYASLEVGSEYLDEAVESVIDELASFTQYGPTQEELQFAKNYLTNQWPMAFDHPTSIASWVENHLLWDDKILLPEDYASLIEDITAEDVVEMIRTHWDFRNLSLIIQGPVKNTASSVEKFTLLTERLLQGEKKEFGSFPLPLHA